MTIVEQPVELEYGGKRLTLTKSEKLVAVKPRSGMETKVAAAIPLGVTVRIDDGPLGGFKIVEFDTASLPDTNDELDKLRKNPAIATGSHVFHTSNDGVPFVPTGNLFIVFKHGTAPNEQQELIEGQSLQIVEARDENEFLVRVTRDSDNPIKVAAALQKVEAVEICEPELATPGKRTSLLASAGFSAPTGGLIGDQWHLRNLGKHRGTSTGFRKGADSRAIAAWTAAKSLGSTDVVVAVIDDGVDVSHPDLSGPKKIVHPWDFTRNSNNPSPDPSSKDWHGTACAGVAVGKSVGAGIYGAAPDAALMPVRWGVDISDSQIEKWFSYVTGSGAWVVSCSWGALAQNFPLSTRSKRAIEKCAIAGRNGKGCVVIFAAGNENRDIDDPSTDSVNGFAIHPNVIAVAASTSMDTRSNYSNYGAAISVCAPSSGAGGWEILTADVTGTTVINGVTVALGYGAGDYTYTFGGTSSACPLVAGICALVLSINPDLTAGDVKSIVEKTARALGGKKGHTMGFGYGCIDAEAAVIEADRRGKLAAGPSIKVSGIP